MIEAQDPFPDRTSYEAGVRDQTKPPPAPADRRGGVLTKEQRAEIVQRVARVLGGSVAHEQIITVVRSCTEDLQDEPPGAMPELVGRLVLTRLAG